MKQRIAVLHQTIGESPDYHRDILVESSWRRPVAQGGVRGALWLFAQPIDLHGVRSGLTTPIELLRAS